MFTLLYFITFFKHRINSSMLFHNNQVFNYQKAYYKKNGVAACLVHNDFN